MSLKLTKSSFQTGLGLSRLYVRYDLPLPHNDTTLRQTVARRK